LQAHDRLPRDDRDAQQQNAGVGDERERMGQKTVDDFQGDKAAVQEYPDGEGAPKRVRSMAVVGGMTVPMAMMIMAGVVMPFVCVRGVDGADLLLAPFEASVAG
jgi:hypothetical protein